VKARTAIYPLLLTWILPRIEAAFDPDNFPAFIRDEPGVHFFGAPSVDGYTVKVSPARMLPPVDTVEHMPTSVDPAILSEVGRAAQRFFPGLHPEPVRYSLHPDSFTTNKVPVIDLSPDGTVVTLAGFSGHGFKFAPIIGEMAADLALTGTNDLLDPSFALAAHHTTVAAA
jgi:sarcosine oxidase